MIPLTDFINKFMCATRISFNRPYALTNQDDDDCRTPFERDWDRVLFSPTFRRLIGKTQLIPTPDDDHTHTRLAHTTEVASVGRCLGKKAAKHMWEKFGWDHSAKEDKSNDRYNKYKFLLDVSQIAANACLIHDIGNPPFGHSGEKSIGSYFGPKYNKKTHQISQEQHPTNFARSMATRRAFAS